MRRRLPTVHAAWSGFSSAAVPRPSPANWPPRRAGEVRSTRNQAGWATLNYDPKTNIAWYGSLHLNTR